MMYKLNNMSRVILLIVIGLVSINYYNYGEVVGFEKESAPSFLVYYGTLDETSASFAAQYDIVVVEPKGTTLAINDYMSSRETLVFGYLSTLGVEGYDSYKIERMREDDYLYINDRKAYIDIYDNYIGDIRSLYFQEILFDVLEEEIIGQGYHGVFLDTADFTEYFEDETLNLSLQMAYIEFLEKVKKRYPDLLIFQNRGFKSYKLGGAKNVDYLLYEDFRADRIEELPYYNNLVKELSNLSDSFGSHICSISSRDEYKNASLSEALGWSFYYINSKIDYAMLPEENENKLSSANSLAFAETSTSNIAIK